jgi:hypothetical protein
MESDGDDAILPHAADAADASRSIASSRGRGHPGAASAPDDVVERAEWLWRACGNRGDRTCVDVVPRRRIHRGRVQPVLPAAEPQHHCRTGASAVPEAERRTSGDGHAATDVPHQHLGERRGVSRTGPGAGLVGRLCRDRGDQRPADHRRACHVPGRPGEPFGAGHESAGVTAPATEWFLAEGATGPFFDLFALVANPGSTAAQIEASYLLPDGTVLVRYYVVAANSRFNIWVDLEHALLADTAVSTIIRSLNNVPIVVERAMW